MTSEGQPGDRAEERGAEPTLDPPRELLAVASEAVPRWLERAAHSACAAGGLDQHLVETDVDTVVAEASARLLVQLEELLTTDVDDQRSTPLSICRAGGDAVAARLVELGVRPPAGLAPNTPAADALGLAPASWADIDPTLHEPGITWGAWKAMTVLRRRRDDGLR